ncbi:MULTISPECIES: hypothetical protein [Enterobacteriaceae]|uniref:hypothetical protein n=1 Tax=Enterobacteriaceae TaxID=543 RepID=UPI000DE48523|nr:MULTISPECIES: hypothetical protein [Enterobacteriaceae]EIY9028113.1 hypothetical protein [Salmonella enterica]MBG1882835.1 hypothetical protein [Klebsiella pneumoniae]EKV8501090.1 hypothetical protein [Escherichia coli]MBG2605465.1 hypothetical protein [Klebsiella oxytoca]MDH8498516.1 hypothetical protein [Klebsiella pneumoniae]
MNKILYLILLSVFVTSCTAKKTKIEDLSVSQTQTDVSGYLEETAYRNSTPFKDGMYEKMSKLKPSEYVSFLSRLRTQALEKPTKEALSEYIFAERVLIESTEYFDNSDELKKYYKPKPDDIHKAKVRLLRKADSTKTVIDYNYMHFLYISMQTGEGSSRENALEYLAAKEIVTKDWRERNQRRKQSAL